MNQASKQAIDAISASPAIRLRYAIAPARGTHTLRAPAVPPAVGGETSTLPFRPSSHYATAAGDPRAVLMRLREEAANEIDRLLEFLDATEGDVDLEPDLGFYNARHYACDAEADDEEAESSLCGLTVDRRFATDNGFWGADREMECEDEGAQCDDEGVSL